jgi:acid stress chaperone HdeB
MKLRLLAAVSVALLAGAPAAQAQVVDISKLSCKEFVGLKPDAMVMLWAWLYGYYADQEADPIVDFNKLTAKGQALAESCQKTPDKDIISVAEDIYEK